jgi:hypothetical protein
MVEMGVGINAGWRETPAIIFDSLAAAIWYSFSLGAISADCFEFFTASPGRHQHHRQ